MNYIVKVKIGDEKYVHVKIFKPLPHTGEPPEVSDVIVDQTLESPL